MPQKSSRLKKVNISEGTAITQKNSRLKKINIPEENIILQKSPKLKKVYIPEGTSMPQKDRKSKKINIPEKTTITQKTPISTKKPPSAPAGVFTAYKKDGTPYFRSSITYRGKHISLGSYQKSSAAHSAYLLATRLVSEKKPPLSCCAVEDYPLLGTALPFEKWVCLLNFRNNGIYCHTPIYLQNRFFLYYLNPSTPLKFDADDLFYYMRRKIMQRGGHLFVSDYGMQVSVLSRYGIHSHAVAGRDYRFVNGDSLDYRYSNIEIINHYHGVTKRLHRGHDIFTARIHIKGNYLVGRYLTETEAAVAYNKAADYLNKKGFTKNFPRNYIEELSEREYAKLYATTRIGRKIREYPDKIGLSNM